MNGLVGRRNREPSRANDCDAGKGKLISKKREIKKGEKGEELKDKGEKEDTRWQTEEGSREQASFISL